MKKSRKAMEGGAQPHSIAFRGVVPIISYLASYIISVIDIWISVMIICPTTQITERRGTAM